MTVAVPVILCLNSLNLLCVQVLNLPPPSPEVLHEYESLDGVPQCLVDNAIFAKDEEEANRLITHHVQERQGMVPEAQRYPTEEGEFGCFSHGSFLRCQGARVPPVVHFFIPDRGD